MGDDSGPRVDDIQGGTAAMWNLLLFELVDAVMVLGAGWLIARALGGGSRVMLALPDAVEGSEFTDDEQEALPPRLELPVGPDGVEWPSSSWRPNIAVPAWNGPSS